METKYCIARISPRTGRVTFAAKSRSLPEWRESGHSVTGVGVGALLTWKTAQGAAKWMASFPSLSDELTVQVVT
jgi:hypothetical protein